MAFRSIRKKAKERAEREAREASAAPGSGAPAALEPAAPGAPGAPPTPAPASTASPAPASPLHIEDALRAELLQLEAGRSFPEVPGMAPPAPAPPPAPEEAPAPLPSPAIDPLEEFFWRQDEAAPPIPDLGLAAAPRPVTAEPGRELREYVTFLLAGEEYAVSIRAVREILKPPPIAEVPRAPAHVLGVITLRGEVVPVIDPRRRLGLPPGEPDRLARVIVCESAAGPVGLLVDAVDQVIRLPSAAIEPRTAGLAATASDAISGIGRERGRLYILLDLEVLLRAVPGQGGA